MSTGFGQQYEQQQIQDQSSFLHAIEQPQAFFTMYGIPLPPSLKESLDGTKVEYCQLGKSGLRVSYPILGALSFGPPKGTIPIVSCTSIDKIEDMCGLKGKVLTDEEVTYLEEAYEARPVAGHF